LKTIEHSLAMVAIPAKRNDMGGPKQTPQSPESSALIFGGNECYSLGSSGATEQMLGLVQGVESRSGPVMTLYRGELYRMF